MDKTGAKRQQRRLARLRATGVERSTVLVHHKCKPALDGLRPHFVDPSRAAALTSLVEELHAKQAPTNVAQVRQLSPFRYPGGKTWLVPEVRSWLLGMKRRPLVFVEPFAGGAMCGLTAAAEHLASRVVLSELDDDVAAVWRVIFSGSDADVRWLCSRIRDFKVSLANVRAILDGRASTIRTQALRTIVRNRMQRGGIMASGASLMKSGEAGRGLRSRWYPETLVARICALRELRERVTFQKADAFDVIAAHARNSRAAFFIDPPYTAGGKNAGRRLYAHNEVDHGALFAAMAAVRGTVMMSYDNAREVRTLAARHDFRVAEVPMKNTHHEVVRELLIMKP